MSGFLGSMHAREINGWKMWGEPAPSVALPPEMEFDVEPTVCGYAPHMPEESQEQPALDFAPVGSFSRQDAVAMPSQAPANEDTVIATNPLLIDDHPAVEEAVPVDGSAPLVAVPGPEVWTTTDSAARPFHWAVFRKPVEPILGFTGTAAADDNELTFIGALDLVPRTRHESEGRGESVLGSGGHTSWVLAAVAALCLLGLFALLYSAQVLNAAHSVGL